MKTAFKSSTQWWEPVKYTFRQLLQVITDRKQLLIIFGKWSLDMSLITSVPNGQLFKTHGKFINYYVCSDPFTFSCNRKSEQQVSLKRDFLHHTGTQKIPSVSPPSNSSGKRFQINCKMPVYEERDPDCHERLEKLWWCLRSNRKQDSMWSWVVCFSAAICNALNLGFVLSFGVLFPVLLDYFNETKERTGE